MGLKSLAKIFNFVCNLCQFSPSLTILVPLWFIIISLLFFYLFKALFLGFLQFKGKFVDGQNTSKCRGRAPLIDVKILLLLLLTRVVNFIIIISFTLREFSSSLIRCFTAVRY